MKRVTPYSLKRGVGVVPLTLLGASFLFGLSGCPGGAELEHPEKYGLTATGGSTATGSGGMTATGGTGTSGSAGSSAPPLTVDCGSDSYQTILTGNCAEAGCHLPFQGMISTAASGLDLTPDSGLVGRLKDVKAQHGDIYCPDGNVCVPASCDPNVLLVNSQNPSASWILTKINGGQSDCGSRMPGPAGPPDNVTSCITNLVNAIANYPK